MSGRWWLYYRSRATRRRLLFGREEIARVERDGWYGRVILVSGAVFKVMEVEPELATTEKEKRVEVSV